MSEIIEKSVDAFTEDVSSSEEGRNGSRFSPNRILNSILVFSLAGVLFYAVATFASDYQSIFHAMTLFPVRDLGIVLFLVTVGWLIRGWRFHYYLVNMGENVPLSFATMTFLAGFALTGTPGKVGEAMKGVFLKRDYRVPVTRVVGVVVVERLMDLFGVLILGSFSLLFFPGWRNIFLTLAAIVIAGGIFLCMEKIYRPILESMSRFRIISWGATKVLRILLSGKDLMKPRIFIIGLIVSVVAWAMEAFSMFIVMKGFGLNGTLTEANFVYCFSTILGALSMLPGGIGGTEASMIGLFAYLGISYSAGLPAVILIRLCTLWYAVFAGMALSFYLLSRKKGATSPVGPV
ncbi:MAG: lysylphosphatidylglycerol synthase transmembrane domain-containing protein [Desulfomonilaceae bacterium]